MSDIDDYDRLPASLEPGFAHAVGTAGVVIAGLAIGGTILIVVATITRVAYDVSLWGAIAQAKALAVNRLVVYLLVPSVPLAASAACLDPRRVPSALWPRMQRLFWLPIIVGSIESLEFVLGRTVFPNTNVDTELVGATLSVGWVALCGWLCVWLVHHRPISSSPLVSLSCALIAGFCAAVLLVAVYPFVFPWGWVLSPALWPYVWEALS